jgi:O-acetylhomoserine (thiol)-lyase
VALRQFAGRYGAVLTLRLDNKAQCFRFINGLKLAQNLANLGDARTLVIHPASTFCRDLSDAERQAVGVSDDLVRLSIGIEDPADILGDIETGLAAV